CYMTVLDLKDAYYHLPIHQDHQQFLRMAVRLNDQDLGWIVNMEKSKLDPSTTQTFLGILLDSEVQQCFLPEEKKQRVVHKVSTARPMSENQKLQNGADEEIEIFIRPVQEPTSPADTRQHRQDRSTHLPSCSLRRFAIVSIICGVSCVGIRALILALQRLQYKTLTMTYKAIHNLSPPYICDLVSRYLPTRNL
ncbi:unnamed protein product, partial [Ranitomeya imitator]